MALNNDTSSTDTLHVGGEVSTAFVCVVAKRALLTRANLISGLSQRIIPKAGLGLADEL